MPSDVFILSVDYHSPCDIVFFMLNYERWKTTYTTLCLLWLIVPVCAETTSDKRPFEAARPLYVGARALGMGNAFTAVADDASAGFWNPAGLIQWQGVKLFAVNKFHDRSDYRFDPKGIGYSYRGYSLFWGNKIAIGVDSGVPDFNYYGIARQLGPYLATGLSLKFKRRHPSMVYQFFGYETAYDLGLLFKPRPNLKFGCPRAESRGIWHSMADPRYLLSLCGAWVAARALRIFNRSRASYRRQNTRIIHRCGVAPLSGTPTSVSASQTVHSQAASELHGKRYFTSITPEFSRSLLHPTLLN